MRKIIIIFISLVSLGSAGFWLFQELGKEGNKLNPKNSEVVLEDKRLEAAFESVDCPTLPRQLDASQYQGPMIDTHVHIASIPDSPSENFISDNERPTMGVNVRMTDYVCMMDTEKTDKVFAFFSVWDPIVTEQLEFVRKAMTTYPDRFVPFIMPPQNDADPKGFPTVDAKALEEMLGVYPGMFKGYGEIGLYARKGGAPELKPDAERMMQIYPVAKKNKLMVYVHLGQGQKESFERALTANPDVIFIWHGDQLITQLSNDRQDLSDIEEILSKHPNAYYGVDELYGDVFLLRPETSKEQFLAHFKNPEPLLKKDLNTWKGFIERHADQVLWGTDRGWSAPWSLDPEVALTLNNYTRSFIGRLDPSVQEKIAYKNAEKLIRGE